MVCAYTLYYIPQGLSGEKNKAITSGLLNLNRIKR